ncbi:MAG TPA: phosphatase PAP2 family protein [Candidatus Paraprevotella stercorigallinarum]|jgi:membrane-associated phospholipid phosphatase|nr:phosphatase PAP2 family protein [Candidatus Paraprevotella stercorigallinarum]
MKYIYIIRTARVFSAIFRPYYMPVVGFIGLFSFTYLSLLPFNFKLFILLAIYCFTILIPQICIFCYRKINGWAPHQIRIQANRTIPYAISIISYVACLWLMYRMHLPRYMCGIIVAALLIQASCATINIWWKISTHSAGAGGIIGALLAYSTLFDFNPINWLCILILISGVVGSSRMLLRQHTLGQVIGGTLLGTVLGFIGIII